MTKALLCRAADEMFWMSRYVERAVAVSRLVEVTRHFELDAGDADDADLWTALLGPEGEEILSSFQADVPLPERVRQYLAFDAENPNSLVACIRKARASARSVRESISSEMWEQLNLLYLSLVDPSLSAQAEEDPHTFYSRIRDAAQFFQGLADSTLAHDETWHFITLGMYLERADNVARVLNLQAHLLLESGDDAVRQLTVLRSCGSAEAYARYYSMRTEPAHIVEFLLLNPVFPQSVRFSVNAAWGSLLAITHQPADQMARVNPAARELGLLRARLEFSAVDDILEGGLKEYLDELHRRVAETSNQVTLTYLRDEPRAGRLVGVARAAMLMAAQQQQQQQQQARL